MNRNLQRIKRERELKKKKKENELRANQEKKDLFIKLGIIGLIVISIVIGICLIFKIDSIVNFINSLFGFIGGTSSSKNFF